MLQTTQINHPADKILLNGEPYHGPLELIVIKPSGVEGRLCTANEGTTRNSYDYLMAEWNAWHHNSREFDGCQMRIQPLSGDYK